MTDSPRPMTGAALRRAFLEYFRSEGHTIVPSATLVPDDPTLFFTNAGMVQFKDIFTGKERRAYNRATTAQKCLRISGKHNDLEEVGHTPRHHTFFEMLGNFSFGDYFKEEAIRFAWTFLVKELGIDAGRLWVTVHHSDDEAFHLWRRLSSVPEARIQRLGDKDNFWSMGDVGPCGPCSEIHYDLGPAMGPETGGPETGSSRYVEIWNLVFMQYEQFADGTREALPRPSVDTGMGLERLASVVQGVLSNYDTDLLLDLMSDAARIAGRPLHGDPAVNAALRVLADHSRATAFLVAEGVIPANEGRAYELRRVVRRAIRYGVKIGLEEPFFHRLTDAVVDRMGDAWPELTGRRDFIREVVLREEERFRETLGTGLRLLGTELDRLPTGQVLPGPVVFQLHDTYGFPPDLTRLIATERGADVDLAGYESAMEHQREMGRSSRKVAGADPAWEALFRQRDDLRTEFVGYEADTCESVILALLSETGPVDRLEAGQKGSVVTARTPFFGESGGQQGDQGTLQGPHGSFRVTDAAIPAPGVVGHLGGVAEGSLTVGDRVVLTIDTSLRDSHRRSHTATHLLHAALRSVLGDHVVQRGSLVAPDRLRFDFAHYEPLTEAQVRQVEDLVYAQILRNTAVTTEVMDLAEAKKTGAMALFGENYGERVRVVSVPGWSKELCGGTHARQTGDIGFFALAAETGIAAGVRRIEAFTGWGALRQVRASAEVVQAAATDLRTSPAQLGEATRRLLDENRSLRKELENERRQAAAKASGDLASQVKEANGVRYVAAEAAGDFDLLREQADRIRDKLGSGVVVLGARDPDKVRLIVAVTKDLSGGRVHAGRLVQELARRVGGKGGGRPDMAQAGGTDPAKLPEALDAVGTLLGG